MLDLFHESLTSHGISCDRQHFHGFLKAVDTRAKHSRSPWLRLPPDAHGSARPSEPAGALCTGGGEAKQRAATQRSREYFQRHRVLAFDEAHVLNIGDALLMKAAAPGTATVATVATGWALGRCWAPSAVAFLEPYFRAGGVVVATSNVSRCKHAGSGCVPGVLSWVNPQPLRAGAGEVAPDDLYASGVNRETFIPFIDTLRKTSWGSARALEYKL
eukprot:Skav218439  [mRNA]  locus=scaffold4655:77836:81616:- [translate_table: standard]